MSDIKKINSQAIDSLILKEMTQVRKSVQETERLTFLSKTAPNQVKNSPYFPDREFSNPLAVQGNAEELSWKEVPTYEDQRNINLEIEDKQALIAIMNGKKLNII